MTSENFYMRNMERAMISHNNERHGLVTSYDDKKHLAKVTFMPEGEESGWLPIEEGHMGNGWGILVGLTPGSGQGSGSGGAGSGGGSGGSGGGSGGGAGGGGSSGGQQYQGDQVIIRYNEGDLESGKIVKRVHSDTDTPPKVKSGEMLMMHSLGSRMFIDAKGQFHIYDRTSNQEDQSSGSSGAGGAGAGAGGAGGGGGGGGGSGGGSGQNVPLKNAPPLEPQSVHIMLDGSGKMTITHYQQDKRQKGQDPSDPTSQKSPSPYASHAVDGKQHTHDTTTYQKPQGGGAGAGGAGGAGAGAGAGSGSSGGGSATPATSQGDPGSVGTGQVPKKFSRTFIDTNKGTHETQIYQDQSDNMMHQVKMNKDGTMTMTSFEEGSDKAMHEMKMDIKGKKMSTKTMEGGKEMASTTWDTKGNIGHKSKGVHSINAANIHINGNTNVTGSLNATQNVTAGQGIGAPTVSGSPGSVGSFSGGGKSPLE